MCATTCTFAQDEEPPEEQTLFEKLKERRLARRDARVNKDGCKPGRERTPELLRIADKKNLESESELIVIAAKAKMDADLAPQKSRPCGTWRPWVADVIPTSKKRSWRG